MKSRKIKPGRTYIYRDSFGIDHEVRVAATGVTVTAQSSGAPTVEGVEVEFADGSRRVVLARHIVAPAAERNPS